MQLTSPPLILETKPKLSRLAPDLVKIKGSLDYLILSFSETLFKPVPAGTASAAQGAIEWENCEAAKSFLKQLVEDNNFANTKVAVVIDRSVSVQNFYPVVRMVFEPELMKSLNVVHISDSEWEKTNKKRVSRCAHYVNRALSILQAKKSRKVNQVAQNSSSDEDGEHIGFA